MQYKNYKTAYGYTHRKPVNENLKQLMLDQTRGCYQESVIVRLYEQGYLIGYMADGKLRGKARNYQSKYQRSLRNVINRINDVLPENVWICSGSVGPKGAFGYYLEVA